MIWWCGQTIRTVWLCIQININKVEQVEKHYLIKITGHKSLWVPKGKNTAVPYKVLDPGIRSRQGSWESALSLLPLLLPARLPYSFTHRLYLFHWTHDKKSLHHRFWVFCVIHPRSQCNVKVDFKSLFWVLEMGIVSSTNPVHLHWLPSTTSQTALMCQSHPVTYPESAELSPPLGCPRQAGSLAVCQEFWLHWLLSDLNETPHWRVWN